MIPKSVIRERGKAARAALGPAVRREYDASIIARCKAELGWTDYERVMVFLPIERQHEIDLWPLVKWIWAEHSAVEVYVPRVIGKELAANLITPLTEITVTDFGIPEPVDSTVLVPGDQLDLILTPLLAFDETGNRVGYGGGYYDRFFKTQPMAERVGLGYECLYAPDIAAETHDIKLTRVITEKTAT